MCMPVGTDLTARSGDLEQQLVAFSRRPRWHDVVEGIFEVERHDDDAIIAVNLIAELTYRIYSNTGSEILAQMPPGVFVVTRVVPINDAWLFSGAQRVLPADDRDAIYRVAADLSLCHPARVFRNPDELAQGWDIQRRQRDEFIEFFGADLVVLPGPQLADRMNALLQFHNERAAAAAGGVRRRRRQVQPATRAVRGGHRECHLRRDRRAQLLGQLRTGRGRVRRSRAQRRPRVPAGCHAMSRRRQHLPRSGA